MTDKLSMKALIVLTIAALMTGCASLKPHTIANAVRGHGAFPGLSVAVQECVVGHPEVRAQIVDPWNRLFDKWEEAGDLQPDATLLVALANAPLDMAEAERDAIFIESTIVDAGLDCGPNVRREWSNIKLTFIELKTAIASNQLAVEVIDWTTLLAGILQGRDQAVTRMSTLPPA